MRGSLKDWVANLFFAHLHAHQGLAMTDQGVEYTRPNPAAMWPPHRKHPTQRRNRKGKVDRFRMAVVGGRVTIAERTKLVGGKGMRP